MVGMKLLRRVAGSQLFTLIYKTETTEQRKQNFTSCLWGIVITKYLRQPPKLPSAVGVSASTLRFILYAIFLLFDKAKTCLKFSPPYVSIYVFLICFSQQSNSNIFGGEYFSGNTSIGFAFLRGYRKIYLHRMWHREIDVCTYQRR